MPAAREARSGFVEQADDRLIGLELKPETDARVIVDELQAQAVEAQAIGTRDSAPDSPVSSDRH